MAAVKVVHDWGRSTVKGINRKDGTDGASISSRIYSAVVISCTVDIRKWRVGRHFSSLEKTLLTHCLFLDETQYFRENTS